MLNELNNIQLIEILKQDNITKKYFLGVFSINTLPKKINKYPSLFILNTSPSNVKEGHWLAIYIDKNQKLEFFDSYGLNPKFYKLNSYINKISKSFSYNKIRYQSYFSNTCGYFCLIYLLLKCRKISIKRIFSKNTIKNEKIINYFFE